jgi:hypothetical protein
MRNISVTGSITSTMGEGIVGGPRNDVKASYRRRRGRE